MPRIPSVLRYDWRTIRIDGWRLVYSVNDADQIVLVVAIRQRGPNTYLNLVL
ncbi:MAG: type II toxin-antitoxin system RelE/ParE family toxin [Caldilineaceae bacterium]|nr:type II toxin-antitoxin system RelE/ParE family toxin [Caldilineaceae bacterium]